MAWNDPKNDWDDGDLVAASDLNKVANDLIFLHQPAFVSVYNQGTMSIPNDAATPISFPDIRNETESSMQGANLTRLNPPYDGLYLISGRVTWPANGTGIRYIQITLNGTVIAKVQRGNVS